MSMIESVITRINESPWRGMVSEVGFGVPFADDFLSVEGASNTILFTQSPYSRAFQPNVERSVSKEAAEAMANRLHTSCPLSEQKGPMFYLAITGSHKKYNERGDSHGWIALKTVIPNEEKDDVKTTLLHFKVKKVYKNQEVKRHFAGKWISAAALWLCKAMLLGDYSSWTDALDRFPFKEVIKIDIIEDPRMSMEEHLVLADNTPLLYHRGEFRRPVEYARKYDRYMGGSFNPPHSSHLEAANGAMFMINFENARKDTVSNEDMVHRLKMIDLLDVPVLIMKGRPFTAQQAHLIHNFGKEEFTIVTGADTFNAICNTKYIPANEGLFEQLDEEQEKQAREEILTNFLAMIYEESGVTLEVIEREGHELVDNQWSQKIKVERRKLEKEPSSSTDARNGDLTGVPEPVAAYIKEHNLYG